MTPTVGNAFQNSKLVYVFHILRTYVLRYSGQFLYIRSNDKRRFNCSIHLKSGSAGVASAATTSHKEGTFNSHTAQL